MQNRQGADAERASPSVIARSLKSPAAAFVRRQKNSAISSRSRCFVGLPRGSLELAVSPDIIILAATQGTKRAVMAPTLQHDQLEAQSAPVTYLGSPHLSVFSAMRLQK
jgi:hypothetical protein